jgi:aspartate ammonia-lyase
MIINEEKCSESVENSDGIIVALLKKVDYQKCLEILERKVQTGKSIKEVCLEMNIMSEEKLNKLLTVDNIKVK